MCEWPLFYPLNHNDPSSILFFFSPPDALSRGKRAWVDRNLEWPLMGDHSTLPFVIWVCVCVCVLFFLGGLKWPTAIYPNRSNGQKDFTILANIWHRTAEPMKILPRENLEWPLFYPLNHNDPSSILLIIVSRFKIIKGNSKIYTNNVTFFSIFIGSAVRCFKGCYTLESRIVKSFCPFDLFG